MGAVGPGDFVKITYHGRDIPRRDKEGNLLEVLRDEEKPLTLMWDSRPYVCPVDKETPVPFEAMMVAFGDPRSGQNVASLKDPAGNIMFVSDRATEVRRLRTLYDNQLGLEGEILYAPDADIVDLENDPVTSVLGDPSGESIIPVQQTALDREQLLDQLKRQQRMIETLAQAQGIDLEDPNVVKEPAPVDDPFKTADLPEDK